MIFNFTLALTSVIVRFVIDFWVSWQWCCACIFICVCDVVSNLQPLLCISSKSIYWMGPVHSRCKWIQWNYINIHYGFLHGLCWINCFLTKLCIFFSSLLKMRFLTANTLLLIRCLWLRNFTMCVLNLVLNTVCWFYCVSLDGSCHWQQCIPLTAVCLLLLLIKWGSLGFATNNFLNFYKYK